MIIQREPSVSGSRTRAESAAGNENKICQPHFLGSSYFKELRHLKSIECRYRARSAYGEAKGLRSSKRCAQNERKDASGPAVL